MSSAEQPEELACDRWLDQFTDEFARGYTFFDFLAAYESAAGLIVVARVLNVPANQSAIYATSPGATNAVPSLTPCFPGATWYEREAAEMFGLQFYGLDDGRPLLRHEGSGAPPMLKSTVLAARAVMVWPGAAEPDPVDGRRRDNPSRRRMSPLGSPPSDWGTADG